jgi:hypothetical protein
MNGYQAVSGFSLVLGATKFCVGSGAKRDSNGRGVGCLENVRDSSVEESLGSNLLPPKSSCGTMVDAPKKSGTY